MKGTYSMAETLKRLKMDIAEKGIPFFSEIDHPSSHPMQVSSCGPPRFSFSAIRRSARCSPPPTQQRDSTGLLVHEDKKGDVWAVYTDFGGSPGGMGSRIVTTPSAPLRE